MKFNEIRGVDIQKSGGNTGEGGGKPMYVYPISLILKTRKRIKLFSAGSEQEAYSLRAKIREILQFEDGVLTPEEKEEKFRTMDLPRGTVLHGSLESSALFHLESGGSG